MVTKTIWPGAIIQALTMLAELSFEPILAHASGLRKFDATISIETAIVLTI